MKNDYKSCVELILIVPSLAPYMAQNEEYIPQEDKGAELLWT